MPQPVLHHLWRKLQAVIRTPVDAPRGIEVPQAVQAGIFRLAVLIDNTAATCAGRNPRVRMLDKSSTLPVPVGNTKSISPLGQASFHSRRVFTTIGGSGTVR
jgi:hypothetical protein